MTRRIMGTETFGTLFYIDSIDKPIFRKIREHTGLDRFAQQKLINRLIEHGFIDYHSEDRKRFYKLNGNSIELLRLYMYLQAAKETMPIEIEKSKYSVEVTSEEVSSVYYYKQAFSDLENFLRERVPVKIKPYDEAFFGEIISSFIDQEFQKISLPSEASYIFFLSLVNLGILKGHACNGVNFYRLSAQSRN